MTGNFLKITVLVLITSALWGASVRSNEGDFIDVDEIHSGNAPCYNDHYTPPKRVERWRGRDDVLLIHPWSRSMPGYVRSHFLIPYGGRVRLQMSVCDPCSDCPGGADYIGELLLTDAYGGTQRLWREIVKYTEGWRDLSFDLSPYQGQEVTITYKVYANDWCSEHAAIDYFYILSIGNFERTYFETSSPLGGWINYRVTGPRYFGAGEIKTFQLEMYPINYRSRPHRYKWVSESWLIGDPNIQIALLIPRNAYNLENYVYFEGLEVKHGKSHPGGWVAFTNGSGASSSWVKFSIGFILEKFLGLLSSGLASGFFLASAAQSLGRSGHKEEALKRFSSEEYLKVPLKLPKPSCDFTAAKIQFSLKSLKESNEPIGILIKMDKRTILGQYETEYHLIEFNPNY